MSPAGTAGGTAVVLARLGADVTSYGAIGTDPIGDTLLALLGAEGVDTSGLVRKDGPADLVVGDPGAAATATARPGTASAPTVRSRSTT